MADKSVILRLQVELYHEALQRSLSTRLTLARHPAETRERRVARLLLWGLLGGEGVRFRAGVCRGDEPEASVAGDDGRPRVWGDVGQPAPERLERAARSAPLVRVLAYGRRGDPWRRKVAAVAARHPGLHLWWTQATALAEVAALLEPARSTSLAVWPETVYVEAGGRHVELPLEVLPSA